MAATETPTRRASRGAEFYSSAVYGAIGAAALIGAFREEPVSSKATALALLSTMTVVWLSHVWAKIVGERIHVGGDYSFRHAHEVAFGEFPIVSAAFAPMLPLLLGWAGILSHEAAFAIALVICDLQLLGWGFFAGLRAYDKWRPAVISGLANGALGIALVGLEIAILH